MAKPTLIQPPRHIAEKVPKSGGPTPEQAIMRALNAAEDLIEGYQGWAVDDLEDLWRRFQEVAHESEFNHEHVQQLFDVSHEIRGQGGTFGFPLISVIGDSLCKFLDGRSSMNQPELEVIRVHILAMKAVFRQGLKGDQKKLVEDIGELLLALRNKIDLKNRFGN